jgi:hypothetical protein
VEWADCRDFPQTYEYSDVGLGLLGQVLALRVGTTYERLLTERILLPLGMTMTGVSLSPAMQRQAVAAHDDRGNPVPDWDIPVLAGAGALHSTLTDMLVFAVANLNPDAGQVQRALATTHVPRHVTGPERRVGLGWHIYEPHGQDIGWHAGETGGSRSFIGMDRAAGAAVVVLTNTAASVNDIGFHLLDERLPLDTSEPSAPVEVAPQVLDRYVGCYRLGPDQTVTITRTEDGLIAHATGLGTARVYPETDTHFVVRVIPIGIDFQLAADHTVTGLVLHYRGQRRPATKLR